MAGTPPPSRYRVVERDRRLVVVDTWAKGRPSRPATPTPRSGGGGATPPMPAATRAGAAGRRPRGIVGALVWLACMGSDDGAGHRILTTHEYYDAHGPRDILLSAAAERRLGNALVAGLVALIAALAIGCFLMPLLVLLFLGGIGINAAMEPLLRPRLTRWLDRLESSAAA